MPIPFHDTEDLAQLGAAAFLHVTGHVPAGRGGELGDELGSGMLWGALLFINARGEPLEFAYNRLELLGNVLWRPAARAQAAVRRLAGTLFEAATLTPNLLLCRATAVEPHLFGPAGQLRLEIPVGRIAAAHETVGYSNAEFLAEITTPNSEGEDQETHIFWTEPPSGPAAALFELLAQRGLIWEPFDRATLGLREVYGEV